MKIKYESSVLSEKELGTIVFEVSNRIHSEEAQRARIVLADGINLANSPEAVEKFIYNSTLEKITIAEYAKSNDLTFEAAEKSLFPMRNKLVLNTRRT